MAKNRGRAGGKKDASTSLNITSMMDMFTIILLFLLKSYSADGSMLTSSEKLILPNSISTEKPKNVKLQLAVTPDFILLDNKTICETKKIREIDDSVFVVHPYGADTLDGGVPNPEADSKPDALKELDNKLRIQYAAQTALLTAGDITEESRGAIIIQVDKNMHMKVVHNIMKICGRNNFSGMKFAVMSREG